MVRNPLCPAVMAKKAKTTMAEMTPPASGCTISRARRAGRAAGPGGVPPDCGPADAWEDALVSAIDILPLAAYLAPITLGYCLKTVSILSMLVLSMTLGPVDTSPTGARPNLA